MRPVHRIVELIFLRKPDATPYRIIALTSVMSKWYAACVISSSRKRKEPDGWKQLHVGGVDDISCQHLQLMMAQLQQKHWKRQEDRRKDRWHGKKDPRCTWPHGHLDGLRRGKTKAQHEKCWVITVPSPFTRCIRQGSVEAQGCGSQWPGRYWRMSSQSGTE